MYMMEVIIGKTAVGSIWAAIDQHASNQRRGQNPKSRQAS